MPCLLPLLASPGTSAFLKTFPECPQLCQTHPTSAHKWSFLFLHSGSPFCPCHQESHRGPQLMMTRPPGSSSAPAKGAASCRICGSPPAFILSERGRYRILLRLVPLTWETECPPLAPASQLHLLPGAAPWALSPLDAQRIQIGW